jgi:hypothetical protein
MKNHILKTLLAAVVAGIISLHTAPEARAQYVWADNAQGQFYQHCYNLNPEYWPSNSSWSQSLTYGSACGGGSTEVAPSNWDPAPPVGVYPGGPGLVGADVTLGPPANTYLDTSVAVGTLTLLADGGLGLGATLTASNMVIQGPHTVGNSYIPAINILPGGTVTKCGGGAFSMSKDGYGNAGGFSCIDVNLVVQTNNTFDLPYNAGGVIFGGTFSVSTNATVVLNVDNDAVPALAGTLTGVGGGTVLMTGSVNPACIDFYGNDHAGLTLNFPGNMFQWSGGVFLGDGQPVTNIGVLNLTNAPGLQDAMLNYGTMNLADNSTFGFSGGGGANLYNTPGGIFNIQGNSSITGNSIINSGLILKSAGAGTAQIASVLISYGGTIEADSGTLDLNVNGAGYYTNVMFVVSNGAAIDFLTNNSTMEIEGNLTATGGGTILMNNGTVFCYDNATLNFPGAMFQWQGGSLGGYSYSGYQPLINANTLNVSGPVAISGSLANNGAMIQSGAGGIGGGNALFNEVGAVYDIQNDNGIAIGTIYNYGLIKKSAGTGASIITGNFENYGTNVPLEVDSGTLALSGNGANYFTNATLVISNGATLDFEAVYSPNVSTDVEGYLTGVGGGTFSVTNGTLSCRWGTTLNFPGSMFQWAGGSIGSQYNNLANVGTINVSGPANVQSYLDNNGMMIQSGAGGISGNYLYNNAGGVYDIQNDNGISIGTIYNYGLIKKSAGTGTSTITSGLANSGANVPLEVDSGTLALSPPFGNHFTNATLVISNGATLDFEAVNSENDNTEIEGYLNGVGGGTFSVTNGTLSCRWGTTLNFPGAMFQWAGGSIGSQYHNLANIGTINVTGPANVQSYLDNNGTMNQSGAGGISGNYLYNNAGGVYDIQNDNGMSLNGIYNYGLFEKTSGTGTSVIEANFANWGQVQATSGMLLFTNETLVQNAGTLPLSASLVCEENLQVNGGLVTGVGTVGNPTLGVSMSVNGGVLAPGNPFGTLASAGANGFAMGGAATLNIVLGSATEFSQLAVTAGGMNLNGTLNVTLVNGYTPAIGTQFQIVSGTPGGRFATLNVPSGISVNYSNAGVYLVVTSAVPAQVESPLLSGNNFTFTFGTVNGQSYTVQQNTNLATPTWTFDTNITGNGSLYEFIAPVTNVPQLFFRVSEP